MSSKVKRIYVEKKPGFNVEAKALLSDLKQNLGIEGLKEVRIINRYDIEGISEEEYEKSRTTIFSEITVDYVYDEELNLGEGYAYFAVEYLPGQYDQRADSASQCVQLISEKEKPVIQNATVIAVKGDITQADVNKIKNYYINPVDSREASLEKPQSLEMIMVAPENVSILTGFNSFSDEELRNFIKENDLAMSFLDLKFCQEYFKNTEKRDPSITEIKVIDTYWSDHCRHTTFQSKINSVEFEQGKYIDPIKQAYENYLSTRKAIHGAKEKAQCLMDIATIGMKELMQKGKLNDIDLSDEINACSIVVDAQIDGKTEKWLVMFKNETHNHPTEIEPFGGAATCIGGAIRDPLSGRTFVYQAMRVTGSGDPRAKIEDTIPGKLPQRKITREAARGYSSYGNQIGLATGQVREYYDEGYVAKRMEIGAVIAAAPKENVVRETPQKGDVVILLGGKTGRDGCGGATGSSKEHTEESILTCGAQVQKGNAPTERKLQRLFRNPIVSKMIKRCNDFGAGGVSVAIGELTSGIDIELDLVPKKYEGLDGTELAISESQERMAVVVESCNASAFIKAAGEENVEATIVAKVTDDARLKMTWRGNKIVDIEREFLDTNGIRQEVDAKITAPANKDYFNTLRDNVSDAKIDIKNAWLNNLKDINVCSQKGLVERFDSSIGAATVLMPFGGKYQATPTEGMAAKLPVIKGETTTATIMTHGCNPDLAKWSPFHGSIYAIVSALAKVVACGGDYSTSRLTLQEYFEKLGEDPEKWGKPLSALLGALIAQKEFEVPAIGGKDSMSGTFMDLNVPPTVAAFAVNVADTEDIISPEFKNSDSKVVLIPVIRDENNLPVFDKLKNNFDTVSKLIKAGKITAASTVKYGGIAEAVSLMSFGNRIGFTFENDIDNEKLFLPEYGSLIVEVKNSENIEKLFAAIDYKILGVTNDSQTIEIGGEKISLKEAYEAYESILENVFPTKTNAKGEIVKNLFDYKDVKAPAVKIAKPKVVITVFPGNNCEYDSLRAFERAGAQGEVLIFRNQTASDIEQSIEQMVKSINNSQIVMIPGGFSAGDEPEGSGKFIAAVFRNPKIKDSVMNLLNNRDGLMIGICNGFQALIKLGLVPYGEIRDIKPEDPTLTYNEIGRHVSRMVNTKVVSKLSPWFSSVNLGDTFTIPVSHGEGRFVGDEKLVKELFKNGQIATQYVDFEGNPTYDIDFNPNGSLYAIEGITSPDGRVLGKMCHSERRGINVNKNIYGEKDQKIFESGVNYFK